jgi:hypothetical protein
MNKSRHNRPATVGTVRPSGVEVLVEGKRSDFGAAEETFSRTLGVCDVKFLVPKRAILVEPGGWFATALGCVEDCATLAPTTQPVYEPSTASAWKGTR